MSLNVWKKYMEFADVVSADNEDIINKYFPDIKGNTIAMKYHNAVKHIFETKTNDKNILEVLPKFYEVYTHYYPLLTTKKQKLSEIRKIIERNQSKNAYRLSKHDKYFNLNYNQRADLLDKYNQDIEKKNKNKIQIDEGEILSSMRTLILSKNPYDRAISLLLASGCRPVELFYLNKFHLIKDKPSYLRITNIAKKRSGQVNEVERPIVMFSATAFKGLVKRLRDDFKGKIVYDENNNKFASDKNKTLNDRIRKKLPWITSTGVSNISSLLRKIYGSLAFARYADPKKENKNTFLSNILSHNSLQTSFSYSIINLHNKDELKESQLQTKMNILEKQMQLLMKKTDKKTKEPAPVKKLFNRIMSEPEKLSILDKTVADLHRSGTKITNRLIRSMGIGSKLANSYLKSYREKQKTT